MSNTDYISDNPLVSVLMTAYNREKYIEDAIKSVLSSTYTNFEFIIVDDCSTDNTICIIKKFANLDSRIRFYQNKKNLGDYANRNMAASYASGKYLKYLDADDIIYENGLEIMVKYMERFPKAGLGISLYKIELDSPYPIFIESKDVIRGEYLFSSYLGLGPSAAIIRNDVFKKLGGFQNLQYIGDTDLWYRLASLFPIVIFNPSLNWYRRHEDQQIFSESKNYKIRIDRLELRKKYLIQNNQYFSTKEYIYAKNRINQHFARSILSEFLKSFNLNRLFYLYKHSSISILDLLNGFKKYI